MAVEKTAFVFGDGKLCVIEDPQNLTPNEGIIIHIDGASEGKFGWCGIVIDRNSKSTRITYGCPETTAPCAEYHAFLIALLNMEEGEAATIVTDSQLIARHLNTKYKASFKYVPFIERAKTLIRDKKLSVTLKWVSREFNKIADKHLEKTKRILASSQNLELQKKCEVCGKMALVYTFTEEKL